MFFCGMKRHFGVVLKKSCIFAFSIRSEISLMLLVHIPRMTNRLGYTLNVLFRHLLRLDFEITVDLDVFERHDGPKLCYGRQQLGDGLFIRSCDLLFQTTIEDQQPRCFRYEEMPALYPVHNAESAFPFDIFAASFFCLARYEEYLPHFTDAHGRFPATESLAYKEHFLSMAVVDRWAVMLARKIKQRYPAMNIPPRVFDVEDTIDIDAAYCYRNKGFIRTLTGLGRDFVSRENRGEIRKRMRVIFNKEHDPFDTFDYILEIHNQLPGMRLKFFPLMADYNVNDKPISYQNGEFRQLLQHLGDYAKMGLHASYASFDEPELVGVESERLASLMHRKTVRNRYHFLRLALPKSYDMLLDNGILHDYTMGYADEPGFRAGTGNPYPFFDLESDCETPLTIHPFAAMDSTFYYYKKFSPEAAEEVYRQLTDEVKGVGGVLSLLWHNQSLCEDFGWQGWRDVYERVLKYADAARKTKLEFN